MRAVRIVLVGLVMVTAACTSKEQQIAEFKTSGDRYFEEEKWSEAKIEYKNLLQLDPENAETQYKMAETLLHLQEVSEARWRYQEAARLDPGNTDARLKLAQLELLFSRFDAAREQLDGVLGSDPNNVEALLLRGRLRYRDGDANALLEDIDRALQSDPNHTAALALKAQALSRVGDVEGAEEYLRKLNRIDPTSENRLALARFMNSLRRNEEALQAFKEAISLAETDQQRNAARLYLANFHINQGEEDQAEQVLLQARGESPGDSTILIALAQFYYQRGKREEAENMLLENAETSDEIGPHIVLVDFYRRLGEREKALVAIDRALEIAPDAEEPRLRKAEAIMDTRPDDPQASAQAWAIVNDVLEKNPTSTLAWFTKGKFELLEEKFEEATASLRRVIDEQPSANAHALLGAAYVQTKQVELARSEFLQALQLDAQHTFARMQLAALYLSTGEREQAAQEAELVLKQTEDVRMRLVRTEALAGLGRVSDARKELAKIEKPQSLDMKTRLQISRLYRNTHDVATASRMLAELLEENPDDPLVRNTIMSEMVMTDLQGREPDKALERLAKWIEEDPDNATLYELRGRVGLAYKRGGKLEHAERTEQDLKTAIEKAKLHPLPQGEGATTMPPYMVLADLYRQTGRPELAAQTYEEALEFAPQNASVAFALAGQLEQLGELERAREMYEKVLQLDQSQPIAKNNLAWIIANDPGSTPEELDRALQLATDAKEALPDNPSVADTLGWVMYKKDIPSAAISLFREAIQGYPEAHPLRGTVRFHLASAYEANGEPDRAIRELREALEKFPDFAERKQAEQLLKTLQSR